MTLSIPFLRIIPKFISDVSVTNGQVFAVLTQSSNDAGKTYVTEKCNVLAFNGNLPSRINAHKYAEARIKDKYRRFQFVVVQENKFFQLCPHQKENTSSTAVDKSGPYQNLINYSEWHYEETLMELSFFYKTETTGNIADGKILSSDLVKMQDDTVYCKRYATLTNFNGAKVKFTFEIILYLNKQPKEATQFLQQYIWNRENFEDLYHTEDELLQAQGEYNDKDNVLNRRAFKDQDKQEFILRNRHEFRPFFVKGVQQCTICYKPILGIGKDSGYKCNKCGLVVHARCTSKIFYDCKSGATDPNNRGNTMLAMIKNEMPHSFKKKKSYFKSVLCDHSSEKIGLFSAYHKCSNCKKNYKNEFVDVVANDCGADVQEIYLQYKKAKDYNDGKALMEIADSDQIYGAHCENIEPIYHKVKPLKVDPKKENDYLGNIANTDPKQLKRLGVDDDTMLKANQIKQKTIKRIKESSINDFIIVAALGEGAYGKVLLCKSKRQANSENYIALKCVRKDITIQDQLVEAAYLERDALMLNHNFLTKAICTFQDPRYLFYAMEFHCGGDLYNLKKLKPGLVFPPESVRIFALEILLGVQFLHRNAFLYRDLKLDNILIGKDGHCKIADFGLVKNLNDDPDHLAYTFCGTPKYMAPEIIRKEPYAYSVDVWAWAVLVYVMSERCQPFMGRNHRELFNSIKWDDPQFRFAKNIINQKDLKDLLLRCFKKLPQERITIAEILKHRYFASSNIDYPSFENLEYQPGVLPPSVKMDDFIKKFDDKVSKNFDQEDIRNLQDAEDQIFDEFNFQNPSLINLYMRKMTIRD